MMHISFIKPFPMLFIKIQSTDTLYLIVNVRKFDKAKWYLLNMNKIVIFSIISNKNNLAKLKYRYFYSYCTFQNLITLFY